MYIFMNRSPISYIQYGNIPIRDSIPPYPMSGLPQMGPGGGAAGATRPIHNRTRTSTTRRALPQPAAFGTPPPNPKVMEICLISK